jgi:hypothetical protein
MGFTYELSSSSKYAEKTAFFEQFLLHYALTNGGNIDNENRFALEEERMQSMP